MKLTKQIVIGLVAGAAVLAQGPPPGGRGFGPGFGPGMGPHGGKVVAGAPYSADVSLTRVETLSDGNTIQQTVTGKIARDSQGRTYKLETSTGGPLGQTGPTTRISIFDPVAGYGYELNPTTKTATRRAIHVPGANGFARGSGKQGGPKWEGHGHEPSAVKAELGTSTINGVAAQGTMTTRTIPAGVVGNANPIISTTETWYSAELQTVVASKHSDPRAGLMNYSLTNIERSEPSAALFQVPAGYTLTDAPHGHGQFGHPGPPPQE
jgi:hypothetical protein